MRKEAELLANKTTEEIDELYLQGKISSRLLWKVMRDKFYRHLFLTTGSVDELTECGFFEDETKPGYFKEISSPNWFTTSVHKIIPNIALDGKNAVLITTGGFSPLHEGHLSMMESAKLEVEKLGYNVAGGYFSPSHDKYVSQKYNGTAARPVSERIRQGELALADSPWLMMDPWEGVYNSESINFTDVYERMSNCLRTHFPKHDITLFYVFGGDNAGFVRAFNQEGYCVCVQRGNTEKWAKFKNLVVDSSRQLFVEANHQFSEYSSKKIREGIIKSQLVKEEISSSLPYIIRNDFDWAVKAFNSRLPVEAEIKFIDRLKELLSIRVKEGSELKVEVFELSEQQEYFKELSKSHKILNLDICSDGDYNISLSRIFGLSDSQISSNKMVARPGAPSIEEQFRQIPSGDYILLEDDVASGKTVEMVKGLLPEGVKITEVKTLAEYSFSLLKGSKEKYNIYDIVDCRDFLVGSKDGGLVVRLPNGDIGRAPYMQPYVNLASRAKVDPGMEISLSVSLWGLNFAFYTEYLPTTKLKDVDPAFQSLMTYLGFDSESLMTEICSWHMKKLIG